jgi:hypothetical protein
MNLTIVEDRTEVAERINSLHAEMTGHMSMAVKKAIQIGELLVEQKNSLEHGEWIPWVESNLTFGRKQAAAYMRVYNRRDEIANVTSGLHLTSLNQAVSLLADPKPEEVGVEQVVEYRDSRSLFLLKSPGCQSLCSLRARRSSRLRQTSSSVWFYPEAWSTAPTQLWTTTSSQRTSTTAQTTPESR